MTNLFKEISAIQKDAEKELALKYAAVNEEKRNIARYERENTAKVLDKTFSEIRKAGYTVSVQHWRYVSEEQGDTARNEINIIRHVIRSNARAAEMLQSLYGIELVRTAATQPTRKEIHPFGGETHVVIYSKSKEGEAVEVARGVASCSLKDVYCRQQGIALALSRALNLLEMFSISYSEGAAVSVQ